MFICLHFCFSFFVFLEMSSSVERDRVQLLDSLRAYKSSQVTVMWHTLMHVCRYMYVRTAKDKILPSGSQTIFEVNPTAGGVARNVMRSKRWVCQVPCGLVNLISHSRICYHVVVWMWLVVLLPQGSPCEHCDCCPGEGCWIIYLWREERGREGEGGGGFVTATGLE